MKTAPIVTVLLPVYNGDTHLKKAIKSIQNQSYKNWELIIINDGSKDDTLKICQEFVKKDNRIKLINNKNNLGLIKSLNIGIELSKGKYIARQDADDISLKNRIEKQVNFLEKNTDYGLVCSIFMVKTEDDRILKITALPLDDYEIKLSLLFFNPITHGAVMFRKDILEKFKLRYAEKNLHCEDYGLWAEMAIHTKFKILPEPLYQWTVSKNGITALNLSKMEEKRRILAEKIIPHLDIKKIKELSKKYKSLKYKHNGIDYLIDYCLMYQKLLLNLAKLSFKQNNHKLAFQLLFQSFFMNPKNYLSKLLPRFNRTDKLPLSKLISKV